jgi:hypothetical protein
VLYVVKSFKSIPEQQSPSAEGKGPAFMVSPVVSVIIRLFSTICTLVMPTPSLPLGSIILLQSQFEEQLHMLITITFVIVAYSLQLC